jgi:putative two-component system hydrogenase maturation factor HypX/HoxX
MFDGPELDGSCQPGAAGLLVMRQEIGDRSYGPLIPDGAGSDWERVTAWATPARSVSEPPKSLRLLFLVSVANGLSPRALIELTERGHQVAVAVADSAAEMEAVVDEHRPQLIVCPFLKTLIPESIWSVYRCLIVHPGPWGDRGPSSLDWSIELGMRELGVTVIEASGEADAGTVWATREFPMREAGKSSLYRHEIRRGAIEAIVEAIDRIAGDKRPAVTVKSRTQVRGRARPAMTHDARAIDWDADTADGIIRRIRAGENHRGVLDAIDGAEFHMFGVHREPVLRGRPGEIIAQRTGAICRATVDGAVWISHLTRRDTASERSFKLPATRALALAGHRPDVPEIAPPPAARCPRGDTYSEIAYSQHGAVGYLEFDFHDGAMSTDQCERLRAAYVEARSQPQTNVIVLMGGGDYFSNGIHLNVIEAAEDPAEESWRNLNAIDDLVREIIETESHLVVSALAGGAAAGGVPLALAADHVVAREDVVLKPYYQHIGGLYGSEYWTYLLPHRIGVSMTKRLTSAPFTPLDARRAVQIGLVDAAFGATLASFHARTRDFAERVAGDDAFGRRLEHKRRRRAFDEAVKPLQAYRDEELARSRECFFGPDRSYHHARRRFVYKLGAASASTSSAVAALPVV